MSHLTTIDSNGSIKIPEEIMQQFDLKPGQQLDLVLNNGSLQILIGSSVNELAGCLKGKTNIRFPGMDEEKAAIEKAREEYFSQKFQPPKKRSR